MSEKIRILDVGNGITAAIFDRDIEISEGDENIVTLTPDQLRRIAEWVATIN